jgi:hypothetical protein
MLFKLRLIFSEEAVFGDWAERNLIHRSALPVI